jgi:hypothetical protein
MLTSSEFVDVGAIDGIDESALGCQYCGCDREQPCLLSGDCSPFHLDYSPLPSGAAGPPYPCSWHRVVELVDGNNQHGGYFAVCTNAECVRAYLSDRQAP